MADSADPARVVVVDDEPENIELVRRACRGDFAVEGFTDPVEALEALARHPADCVIVDYRMPEMTGDEFVRSLRRRDEQVDCVLVTAFGDLPGVADLKRSRLIRRVLLKPVSPDLLRSTVELGVQMTRDRRGSSNP
jgi:CheY-like chemotaxis protein